jgi:hypothetical protein
MLLLEVRHFHGNKVHLFVPLWEAQKCVAPVQRTPRKQAARDWLVVRPASDPGFRCGKVSGCLSAASPLARPRPQNGRKSIPGVKNHVTTFFWDEGDLGPSRPPGWRWWTSWTDCGVAWMLAVLDCMIRAGDNLLPRLFSGAVRSCSSPAGFEHRQLRFGDLGARRARGRWRGRQGVGSSTDGATSAVRVLQGEGARTPEQRRRGARMRVERRAPTPSREDLTLLAQRGSISRAGVSERVCRAPSSTTRGEECYTCEWICLSTECKEQAPGRKGAVNSKNSRGHLGAPVC